MVINYNLYNDTKVISDEPMLHNVFGNDRPNVIRKNLLTFSFNTSANKDENNDSVHIFIDALVNFKTNAMEFEGCLVVDTCKGIGRIRDNDVIIKNLQWLIEGERANLILWLSEFMQNLNSTQGIKDMVYPILNSVIKGINESTFKNSSLVFKERACEDNGKVYSAMNKDYSEVLCDEEGEIEHFETNKIDVEKLDITKGNFSLNSIYYLFTLEDVNKKQNKLTKFLNNSLFGINPIKDTYSTLVKITKITIDENGVNADRKKVCIPFQPTLIKAVYESFLKGNLTVEKAEAIIEEIDNTSDIG